jgi:uncharacterized membrane protein YfcA
MVKNDKDKKIWYKPILIIAIIIVITAAAGVLLSTLLPVDSYRNLYQRIGVLLSFFGFLAMLLSGSKRDTKNGKTIWWVALHRVNWLFISGLVGVILGFLFQFSVLGIY